MDFPRVVNCSLPNERRVIFKIERDPGQFSENITIDLRNLDSWRLPKCFSTTRNADFTGLQVLTDTELQSLQREYSKFKNRSSLLKTVDKLSPRDVLYPKLMAIAVPKMNQDDLDALQRDASVQTIRRSLYHMRRKMIRHVLPAFWVDGFVVANDALTNVLIDTLGFTHQSHYYVYTTEGSGMIHTLFNSYNHSFSDEERVEANEALVLGRWIRHHETGPIRLAANLEEAQVAASINRQFDPLLRRVIDVSISAEKQPPMGWVAPGKALRHRLKAAQHQVDATATAQPFQQLTMYTEHPVAPPSAEGLVAPPSVLHPRFAQYDGIWRLEVERLNAQPDVFVPHAANIAEYERDQNATLVLPPAPPGFDFEQHGWSNDGDSLRPAARGVESESHSNVLPHGRSTAVAMHLPSRYQHAYPPLSRRSRSPEVRNAIAWQTPMTYREEAVQGSVRPTQRPYQQGMYQRLLQIPGAPTFPNTEPANASRGQTSSVQGQPGGTNGQRGRDPQQPSNESTGSWRGNRGFEG